MRRAIVAVIVLVITSAFAQARPGPEDVPMDMTQEAQYRNAMLQWDHVVGEIEKKNSIQVPPAWKLLGKAAVQCGHLQYATAFSNYKAGMNHLADTGPDGVTYKIVKTLHDAVFASLELRYPGHAEAALHEIATRPPAKDSAARRMYSERPTSIYTEKSDADAVVVVKSQVLALVTAKTAGEHEIRFCRSHKGEIEAVVTCRSKEWVYVIGGDKLEMALTLDGATVILSCAEFLKQVGQPESGPCLEQLRFRLPQQVVEMIVANSRDVPIKLGLTEVTWGPSHRVALRALKDAGACEPATTISAR